MAEEFLSLVIPVHNEEENIRDVLQGLKSFVHTPHEAIVVLDHCTDNTEGVLRDFRIGYPSLRWVKNAGKNGFANALIEGFSHAEGKWVMPFMGDQCDDPQAVDQMIALVKNGYEVVCASRYSPGGGKKESPIIQGFLSKWINWFLHHFLSIPTNDASNALKLYPRDFLNSIKIEDAGFAISLQLLLKAYFKGLRIGQVPTVWIGRSMGESKFILLRMAQPYIRWIAWAVWMHLKTRRRTL